MNRDGAIPITVDSMPPVRGPVDRFVSRRVGVYVAFIPLFLWAFTAGCAGFCGSGADMTADGIRPVPANPLPDRPLSIRELQDLCGVPAVCGQRMNCEGQTVLLRAYIDYDAVVHKGIYPQLPYEKFRMYDSPNGPSLEVWAIAEDNASIFRKIMTGMENPERKASVRGEVVGVDLPALTACRREIKLVIHDAESVSFR
jgi:hypothetical protein